MSTHTAPLVGMFHRPPAKAILAALAASCPLQIVPEPSNQFDAQALAVFVRSADIPDTSHRQLNDDAMLMGYEAADILQQEAWQLGYCKATEAAVLCAPLTKALEQAQQLDSAGIVTFWPGQLAFDLAGKPLIKLELP